MNTILAPDFFGGETPVINPGRRSPKTDNGYFKVFDHRNCGNCKNSYTKSFHDKNYRKCKLLGNSNGTGTDVSRNYVCRRHEPIKMG